MDCKYIKADTVLPYSSALLGSFGKWKTLFLAFLEIQNDAKKVHFLEYFEAWLQLWPSANMKTRPLKNKQKFLKAKFPKVSRIKRYSMLEA